MEVSNKTAFNEAEITMPRVFMDLDAYYIWYRVKRRCDGIPVPIDLNIYQLFDYKLASPHLFGHSLILLWLR